MSGNGTNLPKLKPVTKLVLSRGGSAPGIPNLRYSLKCLYSLHSEYADFGEYRPLRPLKAVGEHGATSIETREGN